MRPRSSPPRWQGTGLEKGQAHRPLQPQTPPRQLLESWLLLEVGRTTVSMVYWNDSVFSLLLLISSFHSKSVYQCIWWPSQSPWAGPRDFFFFPSACCYLRGEGEQGGRNPTSGRGKSHLPQKRCQCTAALTKRHCPLQPCCSRWSLQTCVHLWIVWPDGKETNTEMKGSFQKHFIQQFRLSCCISLSHFHFIFLELYFY